MIVRGLEWLYRRLGRWYPTAYLWLELQSAYLIAAATAALVTFYVDTDPAEFLLFLGLVEAFTMLGVLDAMARGRRLLAPVRSWIGGARGEEETVEAWRAASGVSVYFWRRGWRRLILLVAVPGAVAGVMVLDQPWHTFFPLFAGALVSLGYGAVLHHFALELGMRPILVDISCQLPPAFRIERPALPLRVKLMAALPLINIITALVVSGLTSDSDPGLARLGLDVLVAMAVTFTISLELTALLSRSLLAPVRDLLDATDRVSRGDYEVQVPVTTGDELGQLSTAFNQMTAGLAERERIREAFGTYLDHDVAEHILSGGDSAAGEEVEVSILICDVRDFTRLAGELEASEVVARLNRLFEAIVPIVAHHGGHVDKFIGDGLLAVFGAPRKAADHADRAVAAALEIAAAVAEAEADGLRIGIGISSGRVIAGNVGGAGRLDFSVIGDAVNVAARVEAATRETGDDILITSATRELLSGPVELEARPGMRLKGKEEPVELWSVRPPVGARVFAAKAKNLKSGAVAADTEN